VVAKKGTISGKAGGSGGFREGGKEKSCETSAKKVGGKGTARETKEDGAEH